uniref:Toxin candidate TRINITY_DN8688_c0_g1_i1 n=1 Tax=Isarachnanthus nocturnus TaxID=1240238 RepID=A0A7G7WYZ0_9CNID|nr:toxin candidate TRINITY_DN8688_c0_g1_i1 [Isarachnanthus nocturnus]
MAVTSMIPLRMYFPFMILISVVSAADQFQTDMLAAHNKFRSVHAVPPLTMNEQMNAEATAYAQKLASTGTVTLKSSREADNPHGDGENLQAWSEGDFDGYSGTKNWYDEVQNYDWNNPSSNQAAHFTQIVWKGSHQIGIGKALGTWGSRNVEYVVARYRPSGNWLGREPENVFKGSYDAN